MRERAPFVTSFYRCPYRVLAIVAIVLLTYITPISVRLANAETFNPQTTADLVLAFVHAGTNMQDDIIDLGGQTFELTGELILEPDEGYGLILRNGTLQRPDVHDVYRLLTLKEVPYFIEDEGRPILIQDVQFKNGYYHEIDFISGAGGGGALLTYRNTRIKDAQFVDNQVSGNSSGGAIKHSKSLDVTRVTFTNNKAIIGSRSRLAQGGAISADAGASLFVTHSYFLQNSADEGGAIYAAQQVSNLSIASSAFHLNQAQSVGGAIWSNVSGGDVRISNTSFVANKAQNGGGAFYTHSLFANVTMTHVTIWGNESEPGFGGGIRAFVPRQGSNIILRNSILTNNVGGNCMSTNGERLVLRDSSYNFLDDENCGIEGITLHAGVASVFAGNFKQYGGYVPSLPIAQQGLANNLVPRDRCLFYDARDVPRLDNSEQLDTFCDAGAFEYVPMHQIDKDGDNVRNRVDNCVSVSNPLQSDIDNDGIGDPCDRRDDRDSDDDMVLNFLDNCPTVANFLQLDINENAIGDACEQL